MKILSSILFSTFLFLFSHQGFARTETIRLGSPEQCQLVAGLFPAIGEEKDAGIPLEKQFEEIEQVVESPAMKQFFRSLATGIYRSKEKDYMALARGFYMGCVANSGVIEFEVVDGV